MLRDPWALWVPYLGGCQSCHGFEARGFETQRDFLSSGILSPMPLSGPSCCTSSNPQGVENRGKRDVFETFFFWSKNIIVIMQEILIKTTSILETDFFFFGICESLRRVWLYLVILGFDAWLGSRGISGFDAPAKHLEVRKRWINE